MWGCARQPPRTSSPFAHRCRGTRPLHAPTAYVFVSRGARWRRQTHARAHAHRRRCAGRHAGGSTLSQTHAHPHMRRQTRNGRAFTPNAGDEHTQSYAVVAAPISRPSSARGNAIAAPARCPARCRSFAMGYGPARQRHAHAVYIIHPPVSSHSAVIHSTPTLAMRWHITHVHARCMHAAYGGARMHRRPPSRRHDPPVVPPGCPCRAPAWVHGARIGAGVWGTR